MLMKQEVNELLRVDNAAFGGFLMMAVEEARSNHP